MNKIEHAHYWVFKYGKLAKECELCGSTGSLKGHHPDYDYPEIFVTVCWYCHYWIHRNEITTEWQNKNWSSQHLSPQILLDK